MTDQISAPSSPLDHLTVSQALAKYDAAQRASAARAGGPTNRSAIAGLLFYEKDATIARVVYTDFDSRLRVLDLRDESLPPVILTPSVLRQVLCEAYDLSDPSANAHAVAVFADTDTLRRATKMADNVAKTDQTLEARQVSRLLAYRATLPTSAYLPVLTEALAVRYWLPSTVQNGPAAPMDVAAWNVAFAHGKPPHSPAAFSYLIARALDGVTDRDILRAIAGAEKYGARSAQYAAIHSACSAFAKAGTVSDGFEALLSLDPVLRERNAISGLVTKVRIHQIKATHIEAYIADGGRVREGSKVFICDGHDFERRVEVTLRTIDFVNEALMVVLSSAKRKDAHVIESAKADNQPLYVVPAPFLMMKRAPKNKRWTAQGDEKVLHVDIPVDIALAGAPVGD